MFMVKYESIAAKTAQRNGGEEMQAAMYIAFAVLFVLSYELIYIIGTRQQMGLIHYAPAKKLGWALCGIWLVGAVWYAGIGFGILLTVMGFFNVLHSMVGWLLSVPGLFAGEEALQKLAEAECKAMLPLTIVSGGFVALSIVLVPYQSLYSLLYDKAGYVLIVLCAGWVLRFVLRRFVER